MLKVQENIERAKELTRKVHPITLLKHIKTTSLVQNYNLLRTFKTETTNESLVQKI